MNPFVQFLQQVSPLSEESARAFAACVKPTSLAKHELLLTEGKVCNVIYFVEEGLLRLYYYRDAREITDYFCFPGQLIGGIDSFFSRLPSRQFIQALEPCTLYGIRYQDLESLYSRYHEVEHIGRLLATEAFLSMQRRLYGLQFKTAQERYDELLAANPTVVNRVPLGHIASFLGVTQVTLSRIRAKRAP